MARQFYPPIYCKDCPFRGWIEKPLILNDKNIIDITNNCEEANKDFQKKYSKSGVDIVSTIINEFCISCKNEALLNKKHIPQKQLENKTENLVEINEVSDIDLINKPKNLLKVNFNEVKDIETENIKPKKTRPIIIPR
jgi:hypothetical protein